MQLVSKPCQNLVRLPAYLQQQLQSVLNAAARLVSQLHTEKRSRAQD